MLCDRSLGDEKYHPVSWDEAYDLIAEQLKATDPNRAIFYTSGTAVNESAFIFGVLGRRHGSNNLPDCANLCHDSTGVALAKTVGVGKGSIVMQDIYNTEHIISVGQNPGINHPRSLTAFKKQKENGGRFIIINPIPETGLMKFKEPQSVKGALGVADKISDEYVQVRLDGDRALFQQINREVIRRDLLDRKFLEEFCSNVDETIAHLNSLDDAALSRVGSEMCIRDRCRPFPRIRSLPGRGQEHRRLRGEVRDGCSRVDAGRVPAPQRGGHHPGNDELPAAHRQLRQARRGLRPVQWPLQCPG